MPNKLRRLLAGLRGRNGAWLSKARVQQDLALLESSGLFDRDFYLEAYPDVSKAGVDPLRHYHQHGWREFRQPSLLFDTRHYFLTYLAPQGQLEDPLAHYLREGRAGGLAAIGVSDIGEGNLRQMAAAAQGVLDKRGEGAASSDLLKLLSSACTASGFPNLAETALRELVEQQPNEGENHALLAQCLARQHRWWQVEQSAAQAVELDEGRLDWLLLLADAQDRMDHRDEAAASFRRALEIDPDDVQLHYRLGYVLERSGNGEGAERAYQRALALAEDKAALRCGIGVLHEARGLWDKARAAYQAQLEKYPDEAELHYRLGKAYERLYDWPAAEQSYLAAIALSPHQPRPNWHFCLGLVRERQEHHAEAASAYADAIAMAGRHKREWLYRLGYVLEADGDLQRACEAFGQMWSDAALPDQRGNQGDVPGRDLTAPEYHFRRGEDCRLAGDLDLAVAAYRAALARVDEHRPLWFFRLGQVLAGAGRLALACEAFRQTRVLQRLHGRAEEDYRKNEALWAEKSYLEYSECLPLRDNVILYESYAGRSLGCNPLALFRALIEHPDYRDFLHVWVLNDKSRIPQVLRHRENVVFVKKDGDGYMRHLATAKYLINNNGFGPFFIRRAGQKYLETWHGTPLKTLGKQQKYKFYDHMRAERNFLQASHVISPNPHTTQVILDSYDIRQLATARVAESGYPRVDMTLNADDERKQNLKERLGLEQGRPVVLYAPTWRGTPDDVQFDIGQLKHDLARLAQQDCRILFRGHNFMEALLQGEDLDCTVVPGDIDTNELLSIVDVLVTDYSSVFFEFIPLDRPIIFYVHDEADYQRERGLYFAMDEMPGYKCRDIDQLSDALATALRAGVADKATHAKARESFNLHDDGQATRRVIEFFFEDKPELALDYRDGNRPSVLLASGSFSPNGITTSFINLVRTIGRDKVDVVIGFSPETIAASPGNLEQFGKLPGGIHAVPRHGRFAITPDEAAVLALHNTGLALNPAANAILRNAYTREFKRVFGHRVFDTAISFAGYDPFWTGVLAANDLPMRKVIYLHNDMYAECKTRFPELVCMFRLYAMADKLVSVSEQTSLRNRSNLAERYDLPEALFDYCENLIDPEAIRASAQGDLASDRHEALFAGDGPVFITLGRLSPEKDHEKLIRAFAPIAAENPLARLLILGDGPLEQRLRSLVEELGLGAQLHLLGHCANPYPYLHRADCFVLSSNHEGQPMTLLEALVLEKPIVATDIVGNRSVLAGRRALLVDNCVDGLAEGMRSFLRGEVIADDFDAAAYQRDAIAQFYQRVLGMNQAPADNILRAATIRPS